MGRAYDGGLLLEPKEGLCKQLTLEEVYEKKVPGINIPHTAVKLICIMRIYVQCMMIC